jgi:hypothetical protein
MHGSSFQGLFALRLESSFFHNKFLGTPLYGVLEEAEKWTPIDGSECSVCKPNCLSHP